MAPDTAAAITWLSTRLHGRIAEYTSTDGRWTLWSQPFTPVWHVYFDGKFIKDFTKVTAARTWVEAEGAAFLAKYADQIAAAPIVPKEARR